LYTLRIGLLRRARAVVTAVTVARSIWLKNQPQLLPRRRPHRTFRA
jgi:hypothetical protein